jgi:hypothetical protein
MSKTIGILGSSLVGVTLANGDVRGGGPHNDDSDALRLDGIKNR